MAVKGEEETYVDDTVCIVASTFYLCMVVKENPYVLFDPASENYEYFTNIHNLSTAQFLATKKVTTKVL